MSVDVDRLTDDIRDYLITNLEGTGELNDEARIRGRAAINRLWSVTSPVLEESPAPGSTDSARRRDGVISSPPALWKTKPAMRRVVAAATVLLIIGSAAGVTWAILHDPPVFHDNFNDDWVDSTLWINPRPQVKELSGHLWLQNRGCVATTEGFTGPVSISFRWRWINLAEYPQYAEVLTVVLRTTGEMETNHPFEMRDGLLVKIDAQEGSARVRHHPMAPGEPELAGVASGTLPLRANEWHDIKITDDGTRLALYITGSKLGDKYRDVPVLEVPYAGTFKGGRIAVYSREIVAGAQHLSQIDDFEVRSLPAQFASSGDRRNVR